MKSCKVTIEETLDGTESRPYQAPGAKDSIDPSVTFKLTQDEYAHVHAKAEKGRMTVAQFIALALRAIIGKP